MLKKTPPPPRTPPPTKQTLETSNCLIDLSPVYDITHHT